MSQKNGIYGFLLLVVLGSCSAQILQPLKPEHIPPGVVVDPIGLTIQIKENNAVTDPEIGPTSNLIAKIVPPDGTIPGIENLDPPTIDLDIVELTAQDGWDDGFYLKLTSVLDYEGTSKIWAVKLNNALGLFVINVLDLNDRAPVFSNYSSSPIDVIEKQLSTDLLWTFQATDEDSVDSSSLRYSLKDLQSGDGQTPFEIESDTGILKLKEALDYQLRTNYRLQISVTDSGDIHTIDAPIVTTINVVDTPDLPPRWSKFNYLLTIPENTPTGEEVATYEARDDDLGINSPIKYSLLNVPENSDGLPYLEINADSGKLTVSTASLDLEDGTLLENFQISIVAEETLAPFDNLTGDITVVIQDANDNLPTFKDGSSSKDFTVEINESHIDKLPGLEDLIIIDKDKSPTFSSYSVKISDSSLENAFTISPAQGGFGETTFSLLVQQGYIIDYDTDEKWRQPIDFQVIFTDTSNPATTAQANIHLTVKDKNDLTPEFQISESGFIEFEIAENITNGEIVGTILATDGDFSDEFGQKSLKYSWFNRDPVKISLNEDTGEITVANDNAFDFERISDEYYMVEVRDMGGIDGSLRATAEIHIKISDVNDQRPTITLPTRDITLPENSLQGTVVIQDFTITDPDTEPDITVTFSAKYIDQDFSRWFELLDNSDPETPNSKVYSLVVNTALPDDDLPDFEKVERIDITITATDQNTIPEKPDEKITDELFSLMITNVNDEFPKFETISPITVRETTDDSGEEPDRRLIYQFRATDGDKGPTVFNYSLTSEYPEMFNLVELEPNTGILRRAAGAKIDREVEIIPGTGFTEKLMYNVTVSDGEHLDTIEFELTIEDVNDNIPEITNSQVEYTVSEGEPVDFSIVVITATDKDAGNFGKISYFIDQSYNGGIGTDQFSIDQDTGNLAIKILLDRETRPEYELRIQAKDNYRPDSETFTNTGEKLIKIILTDVNDCEPEFRNNSFLDIAENLVQDGTLLGSVIIEDKDEPNTPNSEVSVSFGVICIEPPSCHDGMNPEEYFDGTWADSKYTIMSKGSFQGYYGIYEIEITATDGGVPQQTKAEKYRLTIVDVNDNTPEIIYPEEGTIYYINETLALGSALKEYNSDIPIPVLQATDRDDSGVGNGQVSFRINQTGEGYMFLEIDQVTNTLRVASELVVKVDGYEIELIASDSGTPQPLSTSRIVKFFVVPANNTPPSFLETEPLVIEITENDADFKFSFPLANDPDIVEGGINIYDEMICYFLVDGPNTFIIDPTSNNLTLAGSLDREEFASHDLIIYSKNDKELEGCTIPTNPPLDGPGILKVKINVEDIKDTPPQWLNEGPLISGGIKTTADVGSSTSIILRAVDLDVDDALEYTINDDIYRSDPSLETIPDPVFKLNENKELLVNFIPHDSMKGYFNFTVRVTDSVGMSTDKPVKIYLITQKNVVEFIFLNPFSAFNPDLEDSIATILNHAFVPYRANVDRSVPTTDENGATITGKTTVETHFIDDELNQPLSAVVITNKQYDEPELLSNLTAEFNTLGLTLDIFSYIKDPEPEPDSILPYILMAIVGVLGIALVVLSLSCWFNTRSLSRRVHALSAEAFGQSDMVGHVSDVKDALPNTNIHAISGSNPIWAEDGTQNPNFDNESIGSGGSVLIGVENDDDFKDYKEEHSNPMYQDDGDSMSDDMSDNAEIDLGRNTSDNNNSVMPMSFAGSVSRRNPLMYLNDNEGNLQV